MTSLLKEEPEPRFTGIFIPVEILEMSNLNSTDMILLSWIDALQSHKRGGCFASNAYLAKRMNIKENTIQVILAKLKDLGLIKQVSFNGRIRILKTCKENWYEKNLDHSNSEVESAQPKRLKTINPCGLKQSTPSYIYSKEDIKVEKREGVNAPAPAVFSSSEKKVERDLNVTTSAEEHKALVEKLGEAITIQCYKKLSEWKLDTPKAKWKKSDYRSILRWVITALHEDKVKKAKSPSSLDTPEENKKLAMRIAANFNPVRCKQLKCRIDVMSTEIQLVSDHPNTPATCIRYVEKGFKEQLENAMRKFQLL